MRWFLVTSMLTLSLPALAQENAPASEAPAALPEQLRHFKISGYVQGRFTDVQGKPTNGFSVRRGRLKGTFENGWSRFVLELDASSSGVSAKTVEGTLIEPWTGHGLELTVGQTKLPFGWEVSQSSSKREFPERSRVIRSFAPGERDRGAKLSATWGPFQLAAGVFDGNGIDAGADNDKSKDVIGRLGVDLKWLSGGVSGWWGETARPYDAEGGGFYPRNRLAADAQLQLAVLPLGKTVLRGEVVAGNTWRKGDAEQFGVPAYGWYALLAQHLTASTQLALRWDYFDPDAELADSATGTQPSSSNGVGTAGVALIQQVGKHLELTAAYELPLTGLVASATDPADNILTLQLQAHF